MAQDDFSTGTVELEEAEVKVDRPFIYSVIFNDDFTPWSLLCMLFKNFLDTIMQNLQKSCSKYTIRAGILWCIFPRNSRNKITTDQSIF